MNSSPLTGSPLTAREIECLGLLARGLRHDVLASTLNVSVATIEMHVVNARRKLGAKTTTHAVAMAIARGLISV